MLWIYLRLLSRLLPIILLEPNGTCPLFLLVSRRRKRSLGLFIIFYSDIKSYLNEK